MVRRAPEIDEAFQGISIFDFLELFSQAKDGPNITHFVNSVIILGMGYHKKKFRKRKDIENVGENIKSLSLKTSRSIEIAKKPLFKNF